LPIVYRKAAPGNAMGGKGEPRKMYAEPMILPLDVNGRIYALQDEKGNTIGTGTREVCEVLLYIITKPASPSVSGRINSPIPQRQNVRAAIAI
jgi:hypothetical protein